MITPSTELNNWDKPATIYGNRPHTLGVKPELNERGKPVARYELSGVTVDVIRGREVLWLLIRQGEGGIAMRGVYSPDGEVVIDDIAQTDDKLTLHVTGTTMGRFRAILSILDTARPLVRWEVFFTPAADILMPPQPWNIYPVDGDNDPTTTRGVVYAAQRGSAMGCLYFGIKQPSAGTALYLQNLTALNHYCEQTQTEPHGVVGQNWPGLGFLPPPTERHPLAANTEVSLCDAFIRLWPDLAGDNRACAARFLEGVAEIYPYLESPPSEFRDWQSMAAATVRDLTHSSKLKVEEHGYLYLHPYTSSEYPDSMVQLSVTVGLREYEQWTGQKELPITQQLRRAVPNFFDPKLGMMRRYLATVGGDKDADQCDSWYVYHPLMNLARLAKEGDEGARDIVMASVEYAIKVARHFDYVWPVMFKVNTLDVMTENRKPGEGGQTDVGGLYAYLMLQVFDLTKDKKYVEEAKAALRKTAELGFTIGYQFNNVAWGVVSCMRLFKVTGDAFFRDQANVYLASFFHNVNLWESQIGPAQHYRTFMGVTCLHDGEYMAAYEEFEAYAAFYELLEVGGDDLTPAALLLVTEYCRHILDRAWFFYPSTLPPDILAKEIRNGHIDRSLAIPLEDLYAGRTAPGTVGQEVYGSGMAMALLSRSHHRFEGAPFTLFCGYPLRDVKTAQGHASFRTWGDPELTCRIRLLPRDGEPVPAVRLGVRAAGGKEEIYDHTDVDIPGNAHVTLRWSSPGRAR